MTRYNADVLEAFTTFRDTYTRLITSRVALLGKKIQRNVRSGSDYSSAEKSDILYYVLYAVIADVLGKKNITPADIKNLDIDSITDTLIEDIRNRVYEIYKQHGGNGRVAKSAEFIQYIDNMLDE